PPTSGLLPYTTLFRSEACGRRRGDTGTQPGATPWGESGHGISLSWGSRRRDGVQGRPRTGSGPGTRSAAAARRSSAPPPHHVQARSAGAATGADIGCRATWGSGRASSDPGWAPGAADAATGGSAPLPTGGPPTASGAPPAPGGGGALISTSAG